MRAFPYLRVSSAIQVDGDGFPRQLEAIKAFVASQAGWELQPEAKEEGVSGTVEAVDRPAFAALLERMDEVAAGGYMGCIVVERLDRVARDLMVQELFLRECRDRAIRVFAVDQGLVDLASDDIDPTRKLIRQILGAVAEWEKSALVKKLYAARQRTGRWGGAKAYGTLNENESRLKREIMELHQVGKGYGEIAKLMNMAGETNRRGSPWTRTSVRDVIKERNIS